VQLTVATLALGLLTHLLAQQMAFEIGHCLVGDCERNVLLQYHCDSGYFSFRSVDTVAGTTDGV